MRYGSRTDPTIHETDEGRVTPTFRQSIWRRMLREGHNEDVDVA
jgi:hypothetical protein